MPSYVDSGSGRAEPQTKAAKIHPFEAAGFGHAPFKWVGSSRAVFRAAPDAPAQPGTCCDFCGTGIMDVFRIRSSDGREFKVGSDCIRRTWAEFDAEIPKDIRAAILKVQREKNAERREREFERAKARAARATETLAANPEWFTDRPHPYASGSMRFAGKTLRDYVEWVLRNGFTAGRTEMSRMVEQRAATEGKAA